MDSKVSAKDRMELHAFRPMKNIDEFEYLLNCRCIEYKKLSSCSDAVICNVLDSLRRKWRVLE